MKAFDELVKSLSSVLGWNKRRLNCLSQCLLSIFVVRTVKIFYFPSAKIFRNSGLICF